MIDSHFLALLAGVFACTGFWEFVWRMFESRRKKRTDSEKASLAVLHELIYPKLKEAIIRGKVGYEEFDQITALYEPYIALGGNGTVARRYDIAKELPRFNDTEEGYRDEK